MPNIPDIVPDIDLREKDIINLLLSSIAMEELGLAEIIKAEGRKLEKITCETCDIDVLLKANNNVNQLLRTILKKEMILLMKLETVVDFSEKREKKKKKRNRDCDCDCCCHDNCDCDCCHHDCDCDCCHHDCDCDCHHDCDDEGHEIKRGGEIERAIEDFKSTRKHKGR
jgi:hypothetical protein